jgi:hypothetical protein
MAFSWNARCLFLAEAFALLVLAQSSLALLQVLLSVASNLDSIRKEDQSSFV